MRTTLLMIVFGLSLAANAKPIDWKPCTDITDKFKAEVEEWNAAHRDGFSIQLTCTYSGDPDRKHKPIQKIALRPSEIEHLHTLRRIEHAAYDAMDKYEHYLFRVHRVRYPAFGEPCWYFVGIVWDTDYITVDKNLMSADSECE